MTNPKFGLQDLKKKILILENTVMSEKKKKNVKIHFASVRKKLYKVIGRG